MNVAIVLFDGLTALDAIGPFEVLNRVPDVTVTFVAQRPGPITVDRSRLALVADAALADVPAPDLVVVPGGPGQEAMMDDAALHDWLRRAHETATWTASVCTGSLILAAAGLLRGHRAATHWLALDRLAALGAVAVPERVVFDGRIVTAAGVSAGIDMALALVERMAGAEVAQAIQLSIEYDPQPPHDSGSPATAPAAIVRRLRGLSRHGA